MDSLNIIVVDDNNTFREGIVFYLSNILNHQVIAECEDGTSFLNLSNNNEADIILMDIEMPGLNGIETIKRYLWDNWNAKAIAVTSYEEKVYLTELIGAGFKGCVLKKDIYDELEKAIQDVIQGDIHFPDKIKIS